MSQPGRSESFENRAAPVVKNENPGGGRNCATMEVFESQLAAETTTSSRLVLQALVMLLNKKEKGTTNRVAPFSFLFNFRPSDTGYY